MQNCHDETVAGLILVRNRSRFESARHAIADDDTNAFGLEGIIVALFLWDDSQSGTSLSASIYRKAPSEN
jgi:hypothetical protein